MKQSSVNMAIALAFVLIMFPALYAGFAAVVFRKWSIFIAPLPCIICIFISGYFMLKAEYHANRGE